MHCTNRFVNELVLLFYSQNSLHIYFLHNLPLGEYALDKIRCTGNVNAGTPCLWGRWGRLECFAYM